MKKLLIGALLFVFMAAFTACSSDDDDNNNSLCQICTTNDPLLGVVTTEICPVGNGVEATATAPGIPNGLTDQRDGVTVQEYADALEMQGPTTCN